MNGQGEEVLLPSIDQNIWFIQDEEIEIVKQEWKSSNAAKYSQPLADVGCWELLWNGHLEFNHGQIQAQIDRMLTHNQYCKTHKSKLDSFNDT